ncbi:MAG: hypothetical protein MAG451_00077 [Anaerolineales bacterium]|nr:hypothetical protein [Anaerolineales bacterium]
MNVHIRNATREDFPEVLSLNEQALPQVNKLDLPKLTWCAHSAAYFRVAEANGKVAGTLIAIAHDSGYKSEYLQWFRERHSDFIYIDRVIVAEWARRKRIAWRLYEDLEQCASETSCALTADVYSNPPNDISLSFHRKYGFRLVGKQLVENGTREVAKFLK